MEENKRSVDLVIAGSGSRLIAQVGAIKALEEAGYSFRRIAGCSGGAIVGSLLAAGYTADELYVTIRGIDWKKVRDRKLFSLFSQYKGDYVEQLMKTLLDRKHIRSFDRVPNLHVVASDITTSQFLVFSGNTPKVDVYKAVRYSMSIPLVFAYQTYNNDCVVDGGVQATYPITLFDDNGESPTIGIKMVDLDAGSPNPIYNGWNIFKYHWTRIKAIVVTLWRMQDHIHVEDFDWNTRTIKIFTTIGTTNFDLTQAQVAALYASGYEAARLFLQTFDYAAAQHAVAPAPSLPQFVQGLAVETPAIDAGSSPSGQALG
jgi:NTE family protein